MQLCGYLGRLSHGVNFPNDSAQTPDYNSVMLKQAIHWIIFIAVILHLFSCIFLGQSYMPAQPF